MPRAQQAKKRQLIRPNITSSPHLADIAKKGPMLAFLSHNRAPMDTGSFVSVPLNL